MVDKRRQATTMHVAVLIDTATTWGRGIISGIHGYSRERGNWQLIFDLRGAEEAMVLPAGWRGQGVIARVGDERMLRHLRRRRIPFVNVSAIDLPGQSFPTVANDVERVARLAADYFLDRGFRHFAYFSLRGFEYIARQRDAFVKSVARAGFACSLYEVKPQDGFHFPHWNLRRDRLETWLKSLPKPVAILTWNGGREIVHACHQAGLRIPEEVAVLTGSEDELLCECSPVPISSVQASCREIGYQAAKMLDQFLHGARPARRRLLIPPVAVITRQSTDTIAITDRALVAALTFIRENAARPIQVRDVAARAGLSRRMLERRFKSTLGRTPAEHIGRVRLDLLKKMLNETEIPIGDVAEKCGFCSPEYMTAVFRKEMRTTPLRYRREIRVGRAPAASTDV